MFYVWLTARARYLCGAVQGVLSEEQRLTRPAPRARRLLLQREVPEAALEARRSQASLCEGESGGIAGPIGAGEQARDQVGSSRARSWKQEFGRAALERVAARRWWVW